MQHNASSNPSPAPHLPLPFDFRGSSVRTLGGPGGAFWFVAADISAALGYRSAHDMTRTLEDDEKGTQIVRTPGGSQTMAIINESGLYAAVLRSRKPAAKEFRRWVTGTVLPSLREHGVYVAGQEVAVPEDMSLEDLQAEEARSAAYAAAVQARVAAMFAQRAAEIATQRARALEHRADRYHALKVLKAGPRKSRTRKPPRGRSVVSEF